MSSPDRNARLVQPWRRTFGRFGLSARLLVLTVLFVMLAEVLIYVPSIANFRRTWLNDRLTAAQVAALVLDAVPPEQFSRELEAALLKGVGARSVVVRSGATLGLLLLPGGPVAVDRTVDLRGAPWQTLIRDAFATLVSPAERPIRVIGHGRGEIDFLEMVLDEAPLRAAMIEFSRNILLLSLAISGITAGLVYLALQLVIVRPVRRLAGNIADFAGNPEDASRVITPSERSDEIGLAEQALARMETALAGELRQKRRLAELGLAVSKINHELRNMLTTAQLLTDRLEGAADPGVQRVAPRLVSTLGRAIDFCTATLAYGRAAERAPQRRRIPLAPLVAELADLVATAPADGIRFESSVPENLIVDADPDQLGRVLVNLVRNAVQALSQAGASDGGPLVRVEARRSGKEVTILVCDNGPGLPERARARPFEPFQSSLSPGGSGLGLAIAAELVWMHGGSLSLDDTPVGARFRIVIPDRDVAAPSG